MATTYALNSFLSRRGPSEVYPKSILGMSQSNAAKRKSEDNGNDRPLFNFVLGGLR